MIDDKTYDLILQAIRDGDIDIGPIPVDVYVEGRWQRNIDFHPVLARLVAERDDAIAQMNDADSATDNATQIAERVVRLAGVPRSELPDAESPATPADVALVAEALPGA